MARRLYRQERFDLILRELDASGYTSVGDLADRLGVSTVTVRSDLDLLEQEGGLIRTHGGAVPVPMEGGRYSFAVRRGMHVPAKERIGAYAASLIQDGEAIVVDASTTSWHLAHRLDEKRDITVITNGLHVALELLRWPGVSVMMPGGPLWREAAAVTGRNDDWVINQGNLQRGFFGGRGLTVADGLTDASPDEAQLKRQFLQAVREVNVIVDSTKLGKVSFAPVVGIEGIHRVITDTDADETVVAQLRSQGVEVVTV